MQPHGLRSACLLLSIHLSFYSFIWMMEPFVPAVRHPAGLYSSIPIPLSLVNQLLYIPLKHHHSVR